MIKKLLSVPVSNAFGSKVIFYAYQKDLDDNQTSLQESHVKIEKLFQQIVGY